MTKTVRITSVLVALLAVIFFVFPMFFSSRSGDETTDKSLSEGGVVEKFKKNMGAKSTNNRNETAPLVEEAKKFALYLDPPPPPKQQKQPSTANRRPVIKRAAATAAAAVEPPKPKVVKAKFNLIGTSMFASHPDLSLALIDEPGIGLRWVRQFSKVGHLIIDEVRDGVIVVRDGENTSELIAARPKKTSLLKKDAAEATGSDKTAGIESPVAISQEPAGQKVSGEHSEEEREAALQQMMSEFMEMNMTGGGAEKKEGPAVRKKSGRISSDEAKQLDSLGKKLENDPNQSKKSKVQSIRSRVTPRKSSSK